MANLIHLFKVGQEVRCNMDGTFYKGTVKETYTDHIIVDIPEISDHCWFENNLNMDCVYPKNNFSNKTARKTSRYFYAKNQIQGGYKKWVKQER